MTTRAHIDTRYPRVRVENNIARAETAARGASMAYAEQLAAVHATLIEVRAFPEVYVPFVGDASAVEFAERAAIADLATNLGVAEQTIRAQAHEAETLLRRAPRVWRAFRLGDVLSPNARTIAQLIGDLPESAWVEFENALLDRAATLAPARFRTFARTARDRVDPSELPERHARRAELRRVSLESERHPVDESYRHHPHGGPAAVLAARSPLS